MRKDGTMVHNVSPFEKLIPYIMCHRYDAQNMIKQEIELDPISQYISQSDIRNHISLFSILISAYVKAVIKYPQVNRFVIGKKIYQRNYVSVSFVVIIPISGEKHDQTVAKILFTESDNIFSISEKLHTEIEKCKQGIANKTDRFLDILTKVPFATSLLSNSIKLMDKLGILPKAIIDASPFHTSLFITNLISIRSNYIYHHLYDFGTTCLFASIGNAEKKLILKNDKVVEKMYIPLGIVTDERACTGYDYTQFFRYLKSFLVKPKELE